MTQINNLPYFQFKNTKRTTYLARFLLKKIKRYLLLNAPYHYLIFHRKDKLLKVIIKLSKKYPYFLRFDIEKFYPCIDHQILKEILKNLITSRRGKILLTKQINPFLDNYPIFKKGLAVGNFLAYVLAGYYLLPLDFEFIKNKIPFLRVQDDYLIFLKRKGQAISVIKEIIEPTIYKLKLQINLKKLISGRFHQNKLEFLGFIYYSGAYAISEEKIEKFKERIIKLTHLTNKKPIKAVIKNLNKKILGFGHYYKFANAKETFADLDSFIRQRVRRFILRNKNQKQKLGNILLTNQYLKQLGLKSLLDIKRKYEKKQYKGTKYVSKKYLIFKKIIKNLKENETERTTRNLLKSEKLLEKIYIKEILNKLEEITENLKKLEKLIEKFNKNGNI